MTYDFTPGPWERETGAGRGAWISGPDGQWSALACGKDDLTAQANARLIAAAPDLLKGCIFLLDQIDELVNACYGGDLPVTDEEAEAFEKARSAVAAARGV